MTMAKFPKIGSTARDDLFFAKLANDCLLQAQEHLAHAIKNREEADESYADLQFADQQISKASETLMDYGYLMLDESPEAG
jgi:hypothetical protein